MYFTDCLVLVSLSYSHSFPGNVLQGARGGTHSPSSPLLLVSPAAWQERLLCLLLPFQVGLDLLPALSPPVGPFAHTTRRVFHIIASKHERNAQSSLHVR